VVETVFQQIQEIRRHGTTIFLVEQNARRALAVADRAYVLELGRIRYEGTGRDLLNNPEVQRAYLGV
jgi:ABC-type branched-subunit amino acid transport system ATPase component